jgi:hypothetical protein
MIRFRRRVPDNHLLRQDNVVPLSGHRDCTPRIRSDQIQDDTSIRNSKGSDGDTGGGNFLPRFADERTGCLMLMGWLRSKFVVGSRPLKSFPQMRGSWWKSPAVSRVQGRSVPGSGLVRVGINGCKP